MYRITTFISLNSYGGFSRLRKRRYEFDRTRHGSGRPTFNTFENLSELTAGISIFRSTTRIQVSKRCWVGYLTKHSSYHFVLSFFKHRCSGKRIDNMKEWQKSGVDSYVCIAAKN